MENLIFQIEFFLYNYLPIVNLVIGLTIQSIIARKIILIIFRFLLDLSIFNHTLNY
jgi:hypothetical protein